MSADLWESCLPALQGEFPAQQYNTWIRPLRADALSGTVLVLVAPNRFVRDWVNDKFLSRIRQVVCDVSGDISLDVRIEVNMGGAAHMMSRRMPPPAPRRPAPPAPPKSEPIVAPTPAMSSYAEPVAPVQPNYDRELQPIKRSEVGNNHSRPAASQPQLELDVGLMQEPERKIVDVEGGLRHQSNLNEAFTFESFVEVSLTNWP